mgnify:CR=1 FL=1
MERALAGTTVPLARKAWRAPQASSTEVVLSVAGTICEAIVRRVEQLAQGIVAAEQRVDIAVE